MAPGQAMNRLTQKELDNLAKLYLTARDRLFDTIVNYPGVGTKTYSNTVLQHLNRELELLKRASSKFVDTGIPREYEQGLKDIYSYFTRNNLLMNRPEMWADIHTDAVYGIAREMQYHVDQGLAQVGRQVMRYVDTARDEALRASGLLTSGEKVAAGATTIDMKNRLIEKLQAEGFMTVQYGQGPGAYQVPLDVYANMVARSTTREAGNIARENQLIENGYDLVEMSTHYPTCEICAPLQGRVYSISGDDPRFPPLSVAFSSGYHNVHPNCRHVIVPFIESLQTPEELEAATVKSNQPMKDTRSRQEVELYKNQQAQHRQARQDLYQYERYKARLGDHAPKGYVAFRRMKNTAGANWERLEKTYRAANPKYDRVELNGIVISKDSLAKIYPDADMLEIHYLMRAHEEALKHGLGTGNEKAIAINIKTGDNLFAIGGTSNSAAIDVDALQNSPKNSIIFVHNHPGSSSFSGSDLEVLNVFPSIKFMGVQAHDGTIYSAAVGSGRRVRYREVNYQYASIGPKHSGVTPWKERSHKIIEELCNHFGWRYRRELP